MEPIVTSGYAVRFADDVNTDVLHPSRFFSLEDDRVRAGFAAQQGELPPDRAASTIIVAGRNFGYGSSRETTVRSLLLNGVRGVLAVSVSRIFRRNAINLGLPVAEIAEIEIPDGIPYLTVNFHTAEVRCDQRIIGRIIPPDPYEYEILSAGGIVAWMKTSPDA